MSATATHARLPTLLLIEDDPNILKVLRVVLSRAGYALLEASSGREGLRVFFNSRPALVMLDIELPEMDGWQVLERIRDVADTPVILLTALGMEFDKVRGLQLGADDYVTKPFGNLELLARVEALLRRSQMGETRARLYDDGRLFVDFENREVRFGDEPVTLTPTEFRLLAALVTHPRQILSQDQLLRLAWHDGSGITSDRVKFAVHRLRRKLGPENESVIEALRGFGYRFVPPVSDTAHQQG